MQPINDLIFYSNHARALIGKTDDKIRRILTQGCIEYDKENKVFLCKPIMQNNGKPYNSTTYMIERHKAFGFSCDCQGWQSKFRKHEADPINMPSPYCSHVAALYEYLARQHKDRREMRIGQAMLTMFNDEVYDSD